MRGGAYTRDTEDPVVGQVFFYLFRGSQGVDDISATYGSETDGSERIAGAGDCSS